MRSLHTKRLVSGVLAAAAVLVSVASPNAMADPAPIPDDASEALKLYRELSHKAEQANELHLQAQDELAATERKLKAARADLAVAHKDVAKARQEQQRYGKVVERFARSSYTGGDFSTVAAAMGGKSVQNTLDRAATIDIIARKQTSALSGLDVALKKAKKAESVAADAENRAQQSRNTASRNEWEIAQRKQGLDRGAADVQRAYQALSKRERDELEAKRKAEAAEARAAAERAQEAARLREQGVPDFGSLEGEFASPTVSDETAQKALDAALSKQGSPYVWGATGPDKFDCSGLTSWAYKKAGVSIPRTSAAQSETGKRVWKHRLQPGDLVFFFKPVSHVGMYVGDGKMVHAPTQGDVVKVAPVMWGDYVGARRYS